jgi:signal transduction histidine kinase/ligand-binding sensor domain-containing protein/DNA-binding response OmpR family regulator
MPMLAMIFSFILSLTPGDTINPWPYQHIEKNDGLSNSAINAVYMDRYQYVWFGTWDGLNRYDGTSIKVYKPDSFQKGTISNNIIRNILEDRNGNLWIVTHKGINRYDRDRDQFVSYLTNMEGVPFMEYNTRASLSSDSTLWVSVVGQGVSRYDNKSDSFVSAEIDGISAGWIKDLAGIGTAGEMLCFFGNDGTLVSTINQRTIYSKHLVPRTLINLFYFFQIDHHSYLAIADRVGDIHIYDLLNIEAPAQRITLSSSPISALSSSGKDNGLYAGSETGEIFRLKLTDGIFHAANISPYFSGLVKAQRKIFSITATQQDLLWVGTDGDGVYKYLTRTKPFQAIVAGSSERQNISNSIVRSVFEDGDGTLYIGTRGGGLNILSASAKQSKVFNTGNGLHNNTVLALNKDLKGNVWVGTDGEGVDMIEAGSKKVFHFPSDFENDRSVAFSNVYDICVDAYGAIWLGTSGYGVIELNVSRTSTGRYRLDSFRQITYNASDSGINSNVVYSIIEEMPNILWFGTRGAGIYRYNTLTSKIEEHFGTDSNERNRLSNDDVLTMHLSAKSELWIGTSGGLNRLILDKRSYKNTHYTSHEGLPNNTIHGILEDATGMLWLSTNNGLVLFDPTANTFKAFDVNDGLKNNEFTDGASFRSTVSGKLYFGGINGLDIVSPEKIDTLKSFPRLSIADFQVHNMIVTPSDSTGILSRNIDFTKEIVLDHDQNFISFHFTTLDYWNKQRTEYAYLLENFDKSWNLVGTQSVVNLTNIPPGNYRLLINYKKNGTWSPDPKTMSIIVRAPWWRTGVAYSGYVVLLFALQIAIVLYIRDKAKTKRAAAINDFKIQQMKELNDYKLQFFTNIAHEFRTPLTLIFGPVTTLIKKTSTLWEKNLLQTIYHNSLRLQKLIDELLQFRKIESGKDEPVVSQIDLVQFTQEITDSFVQHAIDHQVHLEFMPEHDSINGWIDKRKIEKILINLISNAIKYNNPGGHVDVVLNIKDNKANFVIRDSGPGIDPSLHEKVFEVFYNNPFEERSNAVSNSAGIGLSLTKSLVMVHRGSIKLDSKVGKGSTFTVTIPINAEAYNTKSEEDNLVNFTAANLSEKVSQEFQSDKLTIPQDGIVPFIPVHEKNILHSILVIDDNDQILILLKNILSDKYNIYTATGGNEAFKILEERKIDLVISDVLMPGMNGLTLCRSIKENIQTSHIPVILLTAKAEIEDRIEGLQVGADSYIPKPFHPEHLFTRIEKLISNREKIRKKFSNLAHVGLEDLSVGMGEKDDQFFVKITQCIQKHLNETEFSADIIAEEVGMSKASLYKKVKAITNLTPHGLIKQYRLLKAADLLKNSSLSVSEVIYETGFNSRSYFYKSFNEMFQCHPKDYAAKAG